MSCHSQDGQALLEEPASAPPPSCSYSTGTSRWLFLHADDLLLESFVDVLAAVVAR